MKLAELLVERADVQKKMAELRGRINSNTQIEEGEVPEESIKELMDEFVVLGNRQAKLIAAINETNSVTKIEEGEYKGLSIMHLLAKRDSIALVKNQYTTLAAQTTPMRYGSSKEDVKFMLTFSPKSMRKEADKLAKEHREIDTLVQSLNWTVEVEAV